MSRFFNIFTYLFGEQNFPYTNKLPGLHANQINTARNSQPAL